MRLIADEHVPPAFVAALRSDGHDVVTVADALELSVGDDEILDHAREYNRAILSADADFRGIDDHPGILACDVEATGTYRCGGPSNR